MSASSALVMMKRGYRNIVVVKGGYFAMNKAGFRSCAMGFGKSKGKK